jgi:cytochrome c peroxidase
MMSNYHDTTTTTASNTAGSGLFNNHGASLPQDVATNNAHLGATSGRDNNNTHLGASTAREGDTLSAGSTANGSFSRMVNHNELEKDFSRQDGRAIDPDCICDC